MGKKCSVKNCQSGQIVNGIVVNNVSIFKLPSNEETRQKWLSFLQKQGFENVSSNTFVCEKHFAEKDVRKEYKSVDTDGNIFLQHNFSKAKLIRGAVPNIYSMIKDNNIIDRGPVLKSLPSQIEKNIDVANAQPLRESDSIIASNKHLENENCHQMTDDSVFLQIFNKAISLRLPDKSWGVHQIDSPVKIISVSQMKSASIDKDGPPFALKQITIDVNLNLKAYIYSKSVNIRSTNPQTVIDLESVIEDFHNMSVCSGGPSVTLCKGVILRRAYKDMCNKWRHNLCPLKTEGETTCKYCVRVSRAADANFCSLKKRRMPRLTLSPSTRTKIDVMRKAKRVQAQALHRNRVRLAQVKDELKTVLKKECSEESLNEVITELDIPKNQEYSEDSNSEPDVDLENQYYNSKALKEDDPKAALQSFQKVLDLEGGDKGEWGFKALKQMIKINFKLSNYKEMMTRYKQLLTYIKSAVTRNHSEKSINSILDYISTSKNMELLQDFYETTLDALKDAKNDRLWFKTNTKLGKLYFDRSDFNKLAKILKQLHQSCQTDDGEDDLKKGTQLLEIYALEIQMYTAQKNNKKLKTLYEQSLHIKSAIPHPLIMGVIRECGGKMHLREGEFERAHTDFFEAFKNYDESGSPRRTTCLKYLVLANMLMKSGINPFDSQEAKPYKNDPEILAMTNLVVSYQNNDINQFESILKQNRNNIMDDPFIREHIEDLLRNIRTQVLIKLIKPYTRIHIPFISKELNIDASEVESLLVSCILDSTVRGRIDQVNQVLELDKKSLCAARYNALDKWTNQLQSLHVAVVNKMA